MQALPQYFPVGVFGTGALLAKATATSSAMIERVGNILLGQLRWRGLSLDRIARRDRWSRPRARYSYDSAYRT